MIVNFLGDDHRPVHTTRAADGHCQVGFSLLFIEWDQVVQQIEVFCR
jgi:hypothetical protein